MAVRRVVRLGHPVLRQRAVEVDLEQLPTPEFQRLIDDMIDTMRDYDGVGLAAPQIGISQRVAVIECEANPRYPEATGIPLTILVNPTVRSLGEKQYTDWEGCLSIAELRGQVPRWTHLNVESFDRDGTAQIFESTDFFARVVQHECDHLDGHVFLDRMADLHTLSHLQELERYWSDD